MMTEYFDILLAAAIETHGDKAWGFLIPIKRQVLERWSQGATADEIGALIARDGFEHSKTGFGERNEEAEAFVKSAQSVLAPARLLNPAAEGEATNV
jgi:hypothetical protein